MTSKFCRAGKQQTHQPCTIAAPHPLLLHNTLTNDPTNKSNNHGGPREDSTLGFATTHAQSPAPYPQHSNADAGRQLLSLSGAQRQPLRHCLSQARHQQDPRICHRRCQRGCQNSATTQTSQLSERRRHLLPLVPLRDVELSDQFGLQCSKPVPVQHVWRGRIGRDPECCD